MNRPKNNKKPPLSQRLKNKRTRQTKSGTKLENDLNASKRQRMPLISGCVLSKNKSNYKCMLSEYEAVSKFIIRMVQITLYATKCHFLRLDKCFLLSYAIVHSRI